MHVLSEALIGDSAWQAVAECLKLFDLRRYQDYRAAQSQSF